jgi:hypothetical protein
LNELVGALKKFARSTCETDERDLMYRAALVSRRQRQFDPPVVPIEANNLLPSAVVNPEVPRSTSATRVVAALIAKASVAENGLDGLPDAGQQDGRVLNRVGIHHYLN